jgi:hypothetical protein
VLSRSAGGKFCFVATKCRFDQGCRSPSNGNVYRANARNCVYPPISRFNGVNKTVGGANQTISEANKSLDRANQTLDRASQTFDRVTQTINRAEKIIDGVNKSFDGAKKHFDGVQKTIEEAMRPSTEQDGVDRLLAGSSGVGPKR